MNDCHLARATRKRIWREHLNNIATGLAMGGAIIAAFVAGSTWGPL